MKSIRSNLGGLTVIAGFIVLLIFIHVQLRAQTQAMSLATFALDGSGRGNDLPAYAFPTKGPWLEITSVSNGLVYLNLHNATDEVYEVWSKIDLLAPSWNIEQEIWPDTNQAVTPFTVPQLDRKNLFIWARDWTGMDENSNGIPDWWEYKYFGHLGIDPNADPDGDGFDNLQEYQNGTDPLNADSAPGLLGRWHFDDTNWLGAQGQLPLLATNLQLVSSWSSNAVELDAPDAQLNYRLVEDNGHTNLNLQCGTVRFWFCPGWSSANQRGLGPGDWPTMIEVDQEPAFWGMYIYPDGNTLEFVASADGSDGSWSYLDATISWTSHQWHQVVVTYSPTNTALYLDGALAANRDDVATIPTFDYFTIGDDRYGHPAMGRFDEMDTFNYSLSAERIAADYLTAINQDNNGNGLPDMWEWDNFGYVGVNPNADPDGDGLTNLQEYELGTDPNNYYNGALPNLQIVSGNDQMGPSGSFLPQPLVIQVTGANSETLSNAPITFTVTGGGAQLATTTNDPATTNLALMTDSNGLASVWIYFPTATNLLGNVIFVQAVGAPVSTNAYAYLDADGNGLPDWWEIQYFGTNGLDPNSAPDGNSQSLLYDYQNGIDPLITMTGTRQFSKLSVVMIKWIRQAYFCSSRWWYR
jgi:hypothetical protein